MADQLVDEMEVWKLPPPPFFLLGTEKLWCHVIEYTEYTLNILCMYLM